MSRIARLSIATTLAVLGAVTVASAQAPGAAAQPRITGDTCRSLPNHAALKAALVAATQAETSGLNNHMWAAVVNRDGVICAVAFSGVNRGAQWPGSRVIAAQKAHTANAFSLDKTSASDGSGQAKGLALSTANLYAAVQPGGSLYGLQHSNPVDAAVAYAPTPAAAGGPGDPLVGKRAGGVNVFGGGLALYADGSQIVGGVGVSGDTSCADHGIAWRLRHELKLDVLAGVGGVSGDAARPDNIVFDITDNPAGGSGVSKGGFGHPKCLNMGDPSTLPAVR